ARPIAARDPLGHAAAAAGGRADRARGVQPTLAPPVALAIAAARGGGLIRAAVGGIRRPVGHRRAHPRRLRQGTGDAGTGAGAGAADPLRAYARGALRGGGLRAGLAVRLLAARALHADVGGGALAVVRAALAAAAAVAAVGRAAA